MAPGRAVESFVVCVFFVLFGGERAEQEGGAEEWSGVEWVPIAICVSYDFVIRTGTVSSLAD